MRLVLTRRSSVLVRVAVATLMAVAWIDGAGLELHARAMACCAHRQDCGGNLRAPDRCCEGMGHGAAVKTGTIVQATLHAGLVATGFVVPVPFVQDASTSHRSRVARLHDPPHLHTFALLI